LFYLVRGTINFTEESAGPAEMSH